MGKFYESHARSLSSVIVLLLIGLLSVSQQFKAPIMAIFNLTSQTYNLLFALLLILTGVVYVAWTEWSIVKLERKLQTQTLENCELKKSNEDLKKLNEDLKKEIENSKTTVNVEHVTMAVVDDAIKNQRTHTTSTQNVLNGPVHLGQRQ